MFMAKKLGPMIQQAAKSMASRATPAPAPRSSGIAGKLAEAAKVASTSMANRSANASAPNAAGFKAMSAVMPKIATAAAKTMAGRRMKTGGKAKKINY